MIVGGKIAVDFDDARYLPLLDTQSTDLLCRYASKMLQCSNRKILRYSNTVLQCISPILPNAVKSRHPNVAASRKNLDRR